MRPAAVTRPVSVTPSAPTVLDLMDLEEIDRDLFRVRVVFDDRYALYGGQVAAQALLAAGRTVPEGRVPHSLHGYYLRLGDASRPTIFRVDRDRDGRSFSARRVVAVQGGKVIFNMSVSFQVPEPGVDVTAEPMPPLAAPDTLTEVRLSRPVSFEARAERAPAPGVDFPTRLWARCTTALPDDPLLHAVILTYLSDSVAGLAPYHSATARSGSSLDHAVWFHRHIRMDDWVLMDHVPRTIAGGRGWYTGTIHARDGVLGASLAQEALFRPPVDHPRRPWSGDQP
ncbi:acyl-CoA thioesterase II [Parafrankia colletiae]|uniref:Acyl-CoA thioesterase II n=1 Tax=Parafrankia colletiae TaxID=573497 RepID=A0A1S1R5S8_9ACTN|nr:acyl-CoA thioesterase domain-containing protein [Parafrankia colletiae]MCK9900716.1 thioesterase family protein [Frankia sp. Cpl3]OHV42328.1 acyl-CoA thioesterase II [Parafrankia colletiae]